MADRLREFYKKIHNSKNEIPLYATIIVRPGSKLIDFKIKKEDANILRVIAHDEKKTGWFIHSFHIPIKNLGIAPDSKDQEILHVLTNPFKIPNKPTRDFVEDILRKYIDILPEKKQPTIQKQPYLQHG